jgi:hypothetical protein
MFKRILSSIFLTFCLWLVVYFSYPAKYSSLIHKASHFFVGVINIR